MNSTKCIRLNVVQFHFRKTNQQKDFIKNSFKLKKKITDKTHNSFYLEYTAAPVLPIEYIDSEEMN